MAKEKKQVDTPDSKKSAQHSEEEDEEEDGDERVKDEDWAEDTSAAAVAERARELSGAVKKLALIDDPYEKLAKFIEQDDKVTGDGVYEEAVLLGIKEYKACTMLMQCLFDVKDVVKSIEEKSEILKKFVRDEKCERAVMGGLERMIGSNPELMDKVPFVLKCLYDEEVVDERVMIEWSEKSSKKYVDKKINREIRKRALPFITWLKSVSSEESSD